MYFQIRYSQTTKSNYQTYCLTNLHVIEPISAGPLRVEDTEKALKGGGVLRLAGDLSALHRSDLSNANRSGEWV